MPKITEQQLNMAELNTLKGLIAYLNQGNQGDLDFEIVVRDSNANRVGVIKAIDGDYQFFYLVEDPA